ncbi:MAG: hypothetical protein K9N51_11545 [Candidatus Pacebacteria bacterium]|nr:hypothetical protein [Candidatus Paceibacterota bacterium]
MIKLRESSEFAPRELPPEGLCHAVCYAVIDLGKQQSNGYPAKWKLLFCFELSKKIESGSAEGQRFGVFKLYTNSSHEKSNLIKDLTSWLGRQLAPGEDIEKLCVGKAACVNIRHRQKKDGDRVYPFVVAVNPPLEGFEPWEPENGKGNHDWQFPAFASRMRGDALEPPEDYPDPLDQEPEDTAPNVEAVVPKSEPKPQPRSETSKESWPKAEESKVAEDVPF